MAGFYQFVNTDVLPSILRLHSRKVRLEALHYQFQKVSCLPPHLKVDGLVRQMRDQHASFKHQLPKCRISATDPNYNNKHDNSPLGFQDYSLGFVRSTQQLLCWSQIPLQFRLHALSLLQ